MRIGAKKRTPGFKFRATKTKISRQSSPGRILFQGLFLFSVTLLGSCRTPPDPLPVTGSTQNQEKDPREAQIKLKLSTILKKLPGHETETLPYSYPRIPFKVSYNFLGSNEKAFIQIKVLLDKGVPIDGATVDDASVHIQWAYDHGPPSKKGKQINIIFRQNYIRIETDLEEFQNRKHFLYDMLNFIIKQILRPIENTYWPPIEEQIGHEAIIKENPNKPVILKEIQELVSDIQRQVAEQNSEEQN